MIAPSQPLSTHNEKELHLIEKAAVTDPVATCALKVLEAVALLFANAVTFGLINLSVEVRRETSDLFDYFFSKRQNGSAEREERSENLTVEAQSGDLSEDAEEVREEVGANTPPPPFSQSPRHSMEESSSEVSSPSTTISEEKIDASKMLPIHLKEKFLANFRTKCYQKAATHRRWNEMTMEEAYSEESERVQRFTQLIQECLKGDEFTSQRQELQKIIDDKLPFTERPEELEKNLYAIKWQLIDLLTVLPFDRLISLEGEIAEKAAAPPSFHKNLAGMTFIHKMYREGDDAMMRLPSDSDIDKKRMRKILTYPIHLFTERAISEALTSTAAMREGVIKNICLYSAFLIQLDGEKTNNALDFIDNIPDETTRFLALGDFSLFLFDLGNKREALEIAKLLPQNITIERESIGDYFIDKLFNKLLELGEYDVALKWAEELDDESKRSRALFDQAQSSIDRGRSEEALALIGSLTDRVMQKSLLKRIINANLEEGRQEEAVTIANMTAFESSKGSLYRVIVSDLLTRNCEREAEILAEGLPPSDDSDNCFKELASYFLTHMNEEEGERVAQKIGQSSYKRIVIFNELVKQYLEKGLYEKAFAIALNEQTFSKRDELIEHIFSSLVDQGKYEQGWAIIRTHKEQLHQDFLEEWIVKLADRGQHEESFDAASSTADVILKRELLLELWPKYIDSNRVDLAIKAIDAIDDSYGRDSKLPFSSYEYSKLVYKLFDIGEIERALEVAKKIPDVTIKSEWLSPLFHAHLVDNELSICKEIAKITEELLSYAADKEKKNAVLTALLPMVYATEGEKRIVELLSTFSMRVKKIEALSHLSILSLLKGDFLLTEKLANQAIDLMLEKWDKSLIYVKKEPRLALPFGIAFFTEGIDKIFELFERLTDDESKISFLSLISHYAEKGEKINLNTAKEAFRALIASDKSFQRISDDASIQAVEEKLVEMERERGGKDPMSDFYCRSAIWLHSKKRKSAALAMANKIPDEAIKQEALHILEEKREASPRLQLL